MKNRKLIIEIVVLSLFLLLVLGTLIFQLAAPDLALSIWVKENIWDLSATLGNLKNHLPVIINSFIIIVIIYAAGRILRIFFKYKMNKNNRNKTIYALMDGFVKYGCAIAIILFILKAFGVDTGALIASVGVLTLVVGLGAQPLIADIIAGIFIIFENEYNVGEIVSINDFRGTVIEIGIRSTKLLDAAGNIKIINNNNVGDVINLSRELSLAVCECDFPYDVPLEAIEGLLNKNLNKIKKNVPAIVDGPYYKGVSEYKDSNVTIKIIAQCKEEDRFQVERDILREYRMILVENDIDIAYPHVVVDYIKEEKDYEITNKEKRQAKKFYNEQKEESQELDEMNNN